MSFYDSLTSKSLKMVETFLAQKRVLTSELANVDKK